MIISASRRTDIPAFYSQWFFNRIKEGYVLVPNPYHPKMISRISLSPAVVDCFVFWTKNPAPMLNQLDKLQDYNYYFQFTLNPYGEKLENRLPSIDKRIDMRKHDKNSPLLIGHLSEDDIVKEREMKSLRDNQYSLF